MRHGLDPAPLLALFHDAPDREVADRLGVSRTAVAHWRRGERGVSFGLADRAATEIGLHPLLIWPDAWETA